MNPRLRYLLATVCAVAAAVLTVTYLAGVGSAGESETEVIWVARQEIIPGVQLSAGLLQLVEVDGPTRRLLAREALPHTPADAPEAWYATRTILPGEALVPGENVSLDPAPAGRESAWPGEMRVVSLPAEGVGAPELRAGEEVDLYVIPGEGREAVRILTATRVVHAEADWVTVLVPDEQVPAVLAATDGLAVKVVRRLEGLLP
ncbi:hypothetical protein [Symbiobacterium terraclitae]|uniref:hypothetical protein n=1 Tax=Symbiobacterium terraclitae TaxID=557451 RepID=UPI0035B54AED